MLENNKKIIIWHIVSTLGSAISLLIIENRIGENIPNFWLYSIIIIILVLVIFLIVSLYINQLVNMVNSKEIINSKLEDCTTCEFNNSICCGSKTFNHIKNDYILVPTDELKGKLEQKYSLKYQTEIIDKIEKNFDEKGGKEIWIVSANLGTELSDEAVDYVAENLNKGIIYKEFYAEKDHEGNISITANNNAKRLRQMYNNSQYLHLVTYDNEISLEGFIFEMYGIVIYLYEDENYEMYYSVRKDGSRPIYYRAPICMADKYFNILKNIYEQNYEG